MHRIKLSRGVICSVAMFVACVAGAVAVKADVAHLLPKVKHHSKTAGELLLSGPVTIYDSHDTPALKLYLAESGVTLADEGGIPVSVEYVDEIPGAFRHDFADWPDEEYSIDITPDGISIAAVSTTGVIRAAQTIAQLSMERDQSLPCVSIVDWPAFKVRGYMHDVGRSYIEFETLMRHIDELARFKINTFHWHLTENQAWRFEVKGYDQLTSTESMTRHKGKFYTQAQCSELARYAAERGVTVIPEIDMPGHSAAFTRAMNFSMQTDEGVAVLKEVLKQVAEVFPDAPYIHIGADEVKLTYPNFLQTMTKYVRNDLGRKVIVWNPAGVKVVDRTGCDMTTTWRPNGTAVPGIPNIDTRYNYVNLNDLFADPVGLFRSTIGYERRGTPDMVGAITSIWNDRKLATEDDIIKQNGFFTFALVNSERAWTGDRSHYIEECGAMMPIAGPELDEFVDFENRLLYHKKTTLKNELVPYVRQTDILWRVTEPMPRANGNNVNEVFPPEIMEPTLSYEFNGKTYGTVMAAGAAVYLAHSWNIEFPNKVKALFTNRVTDNVTSYAYTYVYSPVEQTAGALIEFQTYGRSEVYPAPLAGAWDRKGSDIWVNDERIAPPAWTGATNAAQVGTEDVMGNQNFTAREPVHINLKEGWNKVLIKLPYCNLPGIRLNQWMFTFVLTDLEGENALTDVVYNPDKIMDTDSGRLKALVDDAR